MPKTIRMTPQQIQARKPYVDHMPRVQNDSASTRAMWNAPDPQLTHDPLSDVDQAALAAFRAECQEVNPLEAIRQIDVAFGAWFCEHADSKADDEFAGRMIVILEAVLGKTSADKAFDADARTKVKCPICDEIGYCIHRDN